MNKRPKLYWTILVVAIVCSNCNTYTNFYGKTFQGIPQDILSNPIHRLNLRNQNLHALPESITKLKDLRMLDISGNPNINLEDTFQKISLLKNLQILTLDSLELIRLPEEIRELSNLKQLSLAHNPELDLNHTIDLIDGLPIDFLNLKGNYIEKLPQNIIELISIKDLNLSFNKLTGDKNFELLGKLPNLYSLWLDHNDIDTLSNAIGKLNQVRFLYLDHNNLKTLPSQMSGMKKVWVVHAGYNSFEELPEVFTKMRSLFMVHINNNSINHIPESYETKKYPLAGLILDNNPLFEDEKKRAQELFKGFFLLSFEQK